MARANPSPKRLTWGAGWGVKVGSPLVTTEKSDSRTIETTGLWMFEFLGVKLFNCQGETKEDESYEE
uniref:Uncharacterized protein n=1 Tax=Anguilla anguilla TaxID=7936 RepID=A0A0E9XHZ6_ANGAN